MVTKEHTMTEFSNSMILSDETNTLCFVFYLYQIQVLSPLPNLDDTSSSEIKVFFYENTNNSLVF